MATSDPPLRGYVIGGSERTGTNTLCRVLRRTRRLGHPFEWLRPSKLEQEGLTSLRGEELWARVRASGSTDNGVFAIKVFSHHLAALDDPVLTRSVLALPVVHVHRRDLLGQAISYSRALQTGRWQGPPGDDPVPVYDTDHLTYCLRQLVQRDAEMRLNYAVHGASVTYLAYEDFVAEPLLHLRRVAELVGEQDLELDLGDMLPVQRDSLNEEWRARYLRETGGRPARWSPLGAGPPRLLTRISDRLRGRARIATAPPAGPWEPSAPR